MNKTNRKHDIELVCFDLNHTLIEDNSWQNLNRAMGVSDKEDRTMVEQYGAGEFGYVEWCAKVFNLYKRRGKPTRDNIMAAIGAYTYLPGAHDCVDYLKKQGYKTLLLSGSMDILADKVARELEMDMSAANNDLVFDGNGNLKQIIPHGDDSKYKLEYLNDLADKNGWRLDQIACVGDGASDLLIFEATGCGIAFADTKYEKYAWKAIRELKDIKKIL